MKILIFFVIFIFFCGNSEGKEIFYWKINTTQKVVFLTFDDGPGEYTEVILDILKKYNIQATFFVLGECVKYRKDVLKRIVSEGHSIGNHTYSHKNFYQLSKKMSREELKNILQQEIKKTQQEVFEIVGSTLVFVRLPNGFYHKWVEDILKDTGYKIINWTFGYDWHNVSKEELAKRYCSALQPGGIYLFHDGGKNRQKTLFALEKFIQYCISQGYKFAKLEDYIK